MTYIIIWKPLCTLWIFLTSFLQRFKNSFIKEQPEAPRSQHADIVNKKNNIRKAQHNRKKEAKGKIKDKGKTPHTTTEDLIKSLRKIRPSERSGDHRIEQRPPVARGCFHVCETLIFEVYKLLGGNLCDCVK